MKIPFSPPKKRKLQATTAAARRTRDTDYTEEPNVKLSSAFIVVLVLHVVAVGGIYAFNAIKAHQPPAFEDAESTPAPVAEQAVANAQLTDTQTDTQAVDPAPAQAAAPVTPRTYRVKSGDTIAKIAGMFRIGAPTLIEMNNLRALGGIHVGQELKLPAAPAEDQSSGPKTVALRDSGNTYTVVRGDSPTSIARKLHVSYNDLIALNKIDDPRKLKIGMKIKVPLKHPAA